MRPWLIPVLATIFATSCSGGSGADTEPREPVLSPAAFIAAGDSSGSVLVDPQLSQILGVDTSGRVAWRASATSVENVACLRRCPDAVASSVQTPDSTARVNLVA